jgi:hypothetical protein
MLILSRFINRYDCHRQFLFLIGQFLKIFSSETTYQPIRNKNCLWRPFLLTDQDEMSNLYKEHPIDASYIVSVHLSKQLQRRRFLKIGQTWPNESQFGSKHPWKVLYKDCSFSPDPLTNMAATGNSCF